MSESQTGRADSEAVTDGVRVSVRVQYSEEHSDPAAGRWFFLYTIEIRNEGEQRVQLQSRSWLIIDAMGRTEEVQGSGVVGKQPVLEPGQSFEYTSGCPLPTPYGSMSGTYQMVRADGTSFDAEIAPFQMQQPNALH